MRGQHETQQIRGRGCVWSGAETLKAAASSLDRMSTKCGAQGPLGSETNRSAATPLRVCSEQLFSFHGLIVPVLTDDVGLSSDRRPAVSVLANHTLQFVITRNKHVGRQFEHAASSHTVQSVSR
ncbi:hypothetical protein E2C01_099445 [Portunus trituberculatus]|uniref:Uncharacterized protein n=1 Tax=Portunus trituberculatus TaxID=210409 RepID=A0A5B7K3U8_PORTR|nr:hypothetical protein [Portunus trituberculatus]